MFFNNLLSNVASAVNVYSLLLFSPRYLLYRAGVPRYAIIKKFAGEEIGHLEEFISVLSKLSKGARVPIEYVTYTDCHRRKV